MPFRDTIKDYRRSAMRRLEDATELLEPPTYNSQRSDVLQRHLRGAMYLAGYAVECLLKAYLIQQLNSQTLAAAMDAINLQRKQEKRDPIENIARTAAGHQIFYLLRLTDLQGRPGYDIRLWGHVGQWRSAWRYETDFVQRQEATDFIDAVQSVVDWLSPKIMGE